MPAGRPDYPPVFLDGPAPAEVQEPSRISGARSVEQRGGPWRVPTPSPQSRTSTMVAPVEVMRGVLVYKTRREAHCSLSVLVLSVLYDVCD